MFRQSYVPTPEVIRTLMPVFRKLLKSSDSGAFCIFLPELFMNPTNQYPISFIMRDANKSTSLFCSGRIGKFKYDLPDFIRKCCDQEFFKISHRLLVYHHSVHSVEHHPSVVHRIPGVLFIIFLCGNPMKFSSLVSKLSKSA